MTEEKLSQQAAEHEPTYPRRGRRTWLMVLLCAVILLCGMAIGSGVTLRWLQHKGLRVLRHPEKAPAAMMARLRSKLNLTDEQARQVEEILRKRHESLQGIRREMHPRVQAELEKLRSEVAEVLTPEQAKRWKAHFESRRRRWLRPPPPPSGRPSIDE